MHFNLAHLYTSLLTLLPTILANHQASPQPPPSYGLRTITGTRVDSRTKINQSTLSILFPTITASSSNITLPAGANNEPRRCNGHAELCRRGYGNVTFVGTHNSAFVRAGSVAANQGRSVKAQLKDGVRMLQVQTHLKNEEIHLCHTSCDLLDSGLLLDFLIDIVTWLYHNPNEVLTLLLGNGHFLSGDAFVNPVVSSGLVPFLLDPQSRKSIWVKEWPTLETMISTGKRVVLFVDYLKPSKTTPTYLLEEFTHMFETRFSPTNRSFPCDSHRPPGLIDDHARDMLILANHNLNTVVNIGTEEILIPATAELDTTNAVSGFGSVGQHAINCIETWKRAPNFLLVDYYEKGDAGALKVAAELNGVSYDPKSCCVEESGARRRAAGAFIVNRRRGGDGGVVIFDVGGGMFAGLVVGAVMVFLSL